MSPDVFADDIMPNAPASDCGTLSRLFSVDDLCSRTGCIWHDVVSKSVGTHMAANCITPDLCEKMLRQFLRWLWTSFSSHKTKKFTVAPPVNIQNDWVYFPRLPGCDVLPTNSYVPAWLSVNHWWYQLLSQRWGAQVWCLWQLLPWWTVVVTIAASDANLLFLNRCDFVDFSMRFYALFHAFS